MRPEVEHVLAGAEEAREAWPSWLHDLGEPDRHRAGRCDLVARTHDAGELEVVVAGGRRAAQGRRRRGAILVVAPMQTARAEAWRRLDAALSAARDRLHRSRRPRSPIPPRNRERAAELLVERFGPPRRRDWVTAGGCQTCPSPGPVQQSHAARSVGAGGGPDDVVRQCPRCHRLLHDHGVETAARLLGGVDFAALALELATEWYRHDVGDVLAELLGVARSGVVVDEVRREAPGRWRWRAVVTFEDPLGTHAIVGKATPGGAVVSSQFPLRWASAQRDLLRSINAKRR